MGRHLASIRMTAGTGSSGALELATSSEITKASEVTTKITAEIAKAAAVTGPGIRAGVATLGARRIRARGIRALSVCLVVP